MVAYLIYRRTRERKINRTLKLTFKYGEKERSEIVRKEPILNRSDEKSYRKITEQFTVTHVYFYENK